MQHETLKPSWLLALVVLVVSLSHTAPAEAGIILVGTFINEMDNESDINSLIDEYNNTATVKLPTVQALVDKLDDGDGWKHDVLSNDDFKFYVQDDSGSRMVNIFDRNSSNDPADPVRFSVSNLTNGDTFETLDKPVQGFELVNESAAKFDYYVSKDGKLGWSLWYTDMLKIADPGTGRLADFNPVYTDAGDQEEGDSITGTGFTIGEITDGNLSYDPIKSGVSHISFYSSSSTFDDDAIVPEPASLALMGLGSLLAGAGVLRRKKKQVLEVIE